MENSSSPDEVNEAKASSVFIIEDARIKVSIEEFFNQFADGVGNNPDPTTNSTAS